MRKKVVWEKNKKLVESNEDKIKNIYIIYINVYYIIIYIFLGWEKFSIINLSFFIHKFILIFKFTVVYIKCHRTFPLLRRVTIEFTEYGFQVLLQESLLLAQSSCILSHVFYFFIFYFYFSFILIRMSSPHYLPTD